MEARCLIAQCVRMCDLLATAEKKNVKYLGPEEQWGDSRVARRLLLVAGINVSGPFFDWLQKILLNPGSAG